jgi:ATP-dependent DNA helicase RecG
MVAAFAAFVAIRNGYQAALMAPTEILAEQHFRKLEELLMPVGIRVGRLQGSMTRKSKQQTCELLARHELDLVVGTHALIQEGVEFANLGLVVVDEQHKFGVMQRTVLRQKGRNPDLLVMTATPIPRTLALTLYGELEVSRLDEMPPGRQPIRSESVPFQQRQRIYEEIRREVRQGRQAYIVCPLIDENESLEATAAVEEAQILRTRVFPEFSVGLLHGRMKAAEKDEVMEAFRRGQHHLLISTTVIEVGVDVPNATVMLVQDANRFGLAQLHQLRGRVGRGSHASRCIFMGDATSPQTHRRLQAIARLSDGFEVAEEDLQIRGPGDYYGVRQAGFPELRVADLLRDTDLLELARDAARELLAGDPELQSPEHRVLREHFDRLEARAAEMVH